MGRKQKCNVGDLLVSKHDSSLFALVLSREDRIGSGIDEPRWRVLAIGTDDVGYGSRVTGETLLLTYYKQLPASRRLK